MTGIRYAISAAEESEFGKNGTDFFVLPPNAYMSATQNISTEVLYSPGSKFFDDVVYGRVAGSFEISSILTYEHLEMFRFVFEDYRPVSNGDGTYTHVFAKTNNDRVKSFTIRRRTLNHITGPTAGDDETTLFLGCVIKSCRISQSSGSGKMTVTFSGYYANSETDLDDMDDTGFKEFAGQNVEWACMFMGDEYTSNVESLTLSIDNNLGMQYSTCRDTAINYYEGNSSFQFGMTCYSNDFLRYKALVYTGGQAASNANTGGNKYSNMCKNKHPLDHLSMVSFDTCRIDGETLKETIARASKSVKFYIDKCVVKSATWQKGDGSRMLDQMSSAECRNITMTIVNSIPTYNTVPDDHRVE